MLLELLVETYMELHEVARRLGCVLSPSQAIYRELRRAGWTREEARKMAGDRGTVAQRAFAESNAVQQFIRDKAVWIIPDTAWPRRSP